MSDSLRAIALASLLASIFCSGAAAQVAQGSLEIVITDSTGAVIPGAEVEVTNLETGFERRVEANRHGIAYFPALPPGLYRVLVNVAGFRSFELACTVTAGKTLRQAASLEIAAIAETVQISPGGRRQYQSAWRPRAAERYAPIEESGFQTPSKNPLSTFSSDVDTASYSNVRRFLHDGALPPTDAVRIEEMLNYFRYDDPPPGGDHPIAVAAEVARCPWAPDRKLARIALRTGAISAEDLPPASLTFLLDVSGSMASPDKLPLLRDAFSMLVEQLRPQDSVAIVVYAGAAGVALPPTPGSRKQQILDAIQRLQAGGSTAGAAGIRQAYELAHESFRAGGVNRVILATDGDFNVGVSSEQELVRLIEKERESGVFLTVMGFGTGNLQDAKMERLADHGNGQYLYIDSPLEARRALVEQIGGTLVTVAKDVKIQVEFNPERVRRYRLLGYENRRLADRDFKDDKKDAGDMGAGHHVVALYEIEPLDAPPDVDPLRYQPRATAPPPSPRSPELLFVKVRYKAPDGARSRQLELPLLDADTAVDRASANLRWAAAVAQFGMLLRDSEHKGESSWDSASSLARGALGADEGGERAEFLYLLRAAAKLDSRATTSNLR